jgi:hypothetical protein
LSQKQIEESVARYMSQLDTTDRQTAVHSLDPKRTSDHLGHMPKIV